MKKQLSCLATLLLLAVALGVLAQPDFFSAAAAKKTLAEQVVIRRDTYGVPHILAETEEAAAYAMGYAQAEDHAVEIARRFIAARGEEAKDTGAGVESDFAAQRYGLYEQAQQNFDKLSPLGRQIMSAYAAGFNRYVEKRRREPPAQRLPDWIPVFDGVDVLARSRQEVFRFAFNRGNIIQALQQTYKAEAETGRIDSPIRRDELAAYFTEPEAQDGSNLWSIAGSRTTSGKPILLGNPHQPWSALYWEAHVTAPGKLNFYGSTFVGRPMLTSGFNEHLGWTHTVNNIDLEDIYALPLDPQRSEHYVFAGKSMPLTKRAFAIAVKSASGASKVERRTYWYAHLGPVVHRTRDKVFAIKSSILDEYRFYGGWYEMAKAKSYAQYYATLKKNVAPMFNIGYADTLQAQKKTVTTARAQVNDATLHNVETRAGEWLTHGRNYAETRFSPLKQINAETVKQLGLAWSFDTQTTRGLEATPLVVNGVMYTTGSWSIVYALDAKTGQQLWQYDPQVPQHFGTRACCDVVNRGVAFYQDKVYVGTLDGRLIALDAQTGKPVWSVVTVDQEQAYTITGAPRVVKGKVIIGNGGGEYGVRGYVSAYDAATGKLAWRFYTVPGDPSKPFENDALKKAAATWKGEWWKLGGGGTAWDSFAYDPELNLLYVGTGNGSPWNQNVRSPGGGDNLYLSSIIALRPETGQYVWHYQTTPGDCWDYTATQHMILADLTINGRVRKALMQAPKNGFFYVLERATGQLISAEPYVTVTWAKGVDKQTGRPIENPAARYTVTGQPSLQQPGPLGGHNWMPMSFNPQTGLVYIPAQENVFLYSQERNFRPRRNGWNLGLDFSLFTDVPPQIPTGHLLAWDPVAQKERWRVAYPIMWNGGTLTTAGHLVLQGTADGRFVAYSADKGAKLWEVVVGTGIIATPMTYELDGVQYVTVLAGWGGSFALTGGNATGTTMTGRVLTFALNNKQTLPAPVALKPAMPAPIEFQASAETLALGAGVFAQNCAVCHGIGATGGGGLLPDLRYSAPGVFNKFQQIVQDGALLSAGMPAFKDWLKPEEVEAIRVYLLSKRKTLGQKP